MIDDDSVARLYAEFATEFTICSRPGAPWDSICVARRSWRTDIGNWAVVKGNATYNTLGEWECEPMPSSRTDEYFARTRHQTLETAMRIATELQLKTGWVQPSQA